MKKTGEQASRFILRIFMVLSVFSGVVQIVLYVAFQRNWEYNSIWRASLYGITIAAIAAGLVFLVINDRNGRVHAARMIARALVALLIFAFGYDVALIENTPLSSVFIVQFLCVVTYQMMNDPNLDRHHPEGKRYRGAIPLSFFNLFWIFVICSVLGLLGETIVSLIRDGHWESRAGFVFGPFSPIYGVGAALITSALNLLYRQHPVVLFLVGGTVGALFEYFAGWFFETAFGIVAWSYEGQPFNFHGHTSLLMVVVWGAIGTAWMKLALPYIMQFIDRIPMRARVPLTLVGTIVLLADAIFTIICLDCWYLRKLGTPIETPWQEFCALYFGDEFMQSRFETMSMWPVLAER